MDGRKSDLWSIDEETTDEAIKVQYLRFMV